MRRIYYTNDALNASNLSSLGNVGDLPWRGRPDLAQSVPGWLLHCPQLAGERGMSDVLAHMLQGMLNVIPDGQRELFVTDGTGTGTKLVKSLSGNVSAEPRDLVAFAGQLYFTVQLSDG